MTSGNASEEPIATTLDDARERLRDIADGFLFHDREIVARYDDSVVRVVDAATVLLRRARGYAPQPVPMPLSTPLPLLAVGPHLKNTFALAAGDAAYVSQHIGDLENLETLRHFRETLAAFQQLFAITPEVVVHDAHPGYLSTRVAREMSDTRPIAVQHHHAHVVAVAAEHGVLEPVIGIAFDGTGYGDDGAIWGGEFLVADPRGYTRVGQLRYAPLPGGDTAARQPWRSALAFLSLEPDGAALARTALSNVPTGEWQLVIRQMEQGLNTHRTSSVGRLFDAVAAVLGVRRWSQYEGQAAMELEAAATHGGPLPLPRRAVNGDRWELDPGPLVTALAKRRLDGENLGTLSAVFHESLAEASADLADTIRDARGLEIVALGGGVFQNARLLRSVTARLRQRGFRVLLPRRLSPNDGAISYGQAVIGAARLAGVQPS